MVVVLLTLLSISQHYRYWVLWRCSAVRFLDFQKVKDAERQQARELFGESAEAPTELASKIMGVRSNVFDGGSSTLANGGSAASTTSLPTRMSRIKLTDKEKKRLQDLIKNATSLDEITRLETMIREGRIPAGVQIAGDEMEE